MYSFLIRQFIWEYVGILIRQFSISFRCLFLESNTNTKEKHQRNQWKPMNKNNDKQRTTHLIILNQRKIYEQIKEKQMRTTEKQMKNQRRNNEKQWKTKDHFASILSYLLPVIFGSCFFEVFIFNGERNKRQFWIKKGHLSWGGLDPVCSQNPVNMQ